MTFTFVPTNTYAYSVNYVTDKMLDSLKFIIRECGLDPSQLAGSWQGLDEGIRTWLTSRHLTGVLLEVYDPRDGNLIRRWDFDIAYDEGDGEGGMWVDTDAIRHAIAKAGLWPSRALYRIVVTTLPAEPYVPGWTDTVLRSTDGFVRHSVGTTIGAAGAGTSTAYWRPRCS